MAAPVVRRLFHAKFFSAMRKQEAMKTATVQEWQLDDFKAFALGPAQQKLVKGGDGGEGPGYEEIIDL